MISNGLEHWLQVNKFYVKRGDENNTFTHLLLNGGKLRIPDEKISEFMQLYSQYLDSNAKLYMIEIKTPIFCMILDLDFFQHIPLSTDMIKSYIETIQKSIWSVVVNTHTQHEARVVCCTTDNKKFIKNNEEYIKTGIHLYWPNIYVNTEIALVIRNILIDAMSIQFGERPSHNTWKDVIDKCVLEKNGLRMIGSRKLSSCSYCKPASIDKQSCKMCFGKGRIDEGRAYSPFLVIDGKGRELKAHLAKLKKSSLKALEETSIRTKFEDLPKPLSIPDKYKITKRATKSKRCGGKGEMLFSLATGLSSNKVSVPHDSKTFKLCVAFLKSTFPQQNYNILEIFKPSKDNNYYVVQTDSKFCLNVGREHNSNHIYFYMDKSFAYQKCFCTCDTTIGRKYGKCSDYKSSHRKIPFDLQKLLYPLDKDKLGIMFEIPPINKIYTKTDRKRHVDSLKGYADILMDDVCRRCERENKLCR